MIAPREITCRSVKGRVLDYFVVSDVRVPSVKGCSAAVNSFLAPHGPVGLRLAARAVPTSIL
eukprot:6167380-Pyramimonas_sp.AAC.1